MSEDTREPVAEDPNIVVGGPMGGGPETKPASTAGESAVDKPLYTGLVGDLKNVDDLIGYTRNLETMMTARGATPAPATAKSFSVANVPTPNAAKPAPKAKFADVVYTDAEAAEQILLAKFDERQAERNEAARRQQSFWSQFYDKNADLKRVQHVVQSVFERDMGRIQSLANDEQVEQHLVRESRRIVEEVKKTIGVTETRLDSAPAVTIGSGGSDYARATTPPAKQQNFIEQWTGMKAGRGKLKSRGNS